ncbi:MAG: extracellular solute-binding protein [Limnochordia bacterium]
MKRLVKTMVLSLLLVSLLTSGTWAVSITHLTYVHHGDAFLRYLETKAAEFKELTGIEVEIIVGNQEKFKTMLAGGADPDIHDLPDFDYLALSGYYVDIIPLLKKDGLLRQFNPGLIKSMSAKNGALYKVPQGIASVVGFFNRTMFLEAGITPPDRLGSEYDWEAVIQLGKKLTRDADGDGVPETFGVDRGYAYWRRAVAQAGGRFYEYDDQGQPIKSLWNTPEVEQGLSFVARMWEEGIIPWMRVPRHDEYFFWTGKTGIDIVDATGIIGSYLSQVSFDWDMTLLPAGPKGPIASGAGGYGPNIMASTKHLDEAWEWCKFLFINKSNMEDMMALVGTVPALISAQPAYAAIANLRDKNYQAIFDALNYLPPPEYGAVPQELSARSVNVNDVILGKVPVRQFLQQLHIQKQAIVDDLRRAGK